MGEEKKNLNMILLGPPGAGKGTQAKHLVEEFDVVHISTGDILRRAVAEGTEVGKRAQEYMNRGELVPDTVVVALVADRIGESDCVENGWLLDGFPRNIAQAKALESTCSEAGLPTADMVIFLNVPSAVVVERLSGRRTCKDCGATYHVTFMPPKKDGVCDKCGGSNLIQRDDDKAEAIEKRLETYSEQTKELVRHYRQAGTLVEVDADGKPGEVTEKMIAAVKGR